MFKAAIGDEVKIYYDADEPVCVTDCLQTRTGRTYEVIALRKQKSGQRPGRYHLTCRVVKEPPFYSDKTLPLCWYSRSKKKRR